MRHLSGSHSGVRDFAQNPHISEKKVSSDLTAQIFDDDKQIDLDILKLYFYFFIALWIHFVTIAGKDEHIFE